MNAANIAGLQKPQTLKPVVKRAEDYLATMRAMNRSPSQIVFTPQHYDALLASFNRGREPEAKFTGLHINGIPVSRGAAK